MMERAKQLKILLAGIQGDFGRISCGLQHEAVINLRIRLFQLKLLRNIDGELLDSTDWDSRMVDGQISARI